jgi:hypothetical protein
VVVIKMAKTRRQVLSGQAAQQQNGDVVFDRPVDISAALDILNNNDGLHCQLV